MSDEYPDAVPLEYFPLALSCTACGSAWLQSPTFGDGWPQWGMIIVCVHCGYAMKLVPVELVDFTREEAEYIQNHEAFPRVRAMQEQVHRERNHWG